MKTSLFNQVIARNKWVFTCLVCLFLFKTATAQNACTTTQKDLVAWWKMDEASGTTASDASGHNNTGQLVNPFWSNISRAGSGAVYLPAAAYMRAPNFANWQPSTFSVAWWVEPYAAYNYNLAVRATNGWGSFFFHTTAGGAVCVGTDIATRLDAGNLPAGTVEISKWQHFAFTYGNGIGSLYKNGRLLASRAMNAPTSWGGFTVGGDPNTGEAPAAGAFDDMRVYSRALSADEVATLASGVACPAVPLAAASPTGDTEYNWTETVSYNRQGIETGSARQYVDERGRVLQNQVNDHATSQVLASQPVYDALDRPAIATLPAPINNAAFRLKTDFITSSTTPNQPYSVADFDANPDNPTAVAASSPGTLGWYYSTSNTLEPDVASTSYPYSRTEAYMDGTGETKRTAGPGDYFRAGSTHETTGGTFPVVSELDAYAAIRAKYFPNAGGSPATLKYHGMQAVSTNSQGTTAVAVGDEVGHPVMSALPNSSSQAWLQVNNTVALSQERYTLTAALGQASTLIVRKIEASSPFNILIVTASNKVVYNGLNTQLLSYGFTGRGFSEPITFIADSYFTVDYEQDGYERFYTQPATKAQSYAQHQFYLLSTQQVTVTAAPTTMAKPSVSYKLLNISTSAVVGSGTGTSTFNLPQGFYKLVCEAGNISVQYSNAYDQVSFSFYNQRGQLIGSLAPNGVKVLLDELRTTGTLTTYSTASTVPYLTTCEYDLRGRLTSRTDPDGGRTAYSYRSDGKVRFTQNSKQAAANKLSFVNYDSSGRAIETGEYVCSTGESFQSLGSNDAVLDNTSISGGVGSRQQFTAMTYDQPVSTGLNGYDQEFVAGRLVTTARYDNGQLVAKTWYSYDELGRVKWLVKQVSTLPAKTINYTYNELGTVATVCYQQNVPTERFTHYYSFDANRRLTKVETNFASPTDQGVLRTVQGRYSYYLHGPLKRVEIGDDLQGVDYTYTVQGWLKNINHPITVRDPGQDGTANNRLPDLFSQSLEYYGANDYQSARTPAGIITSNNSSARYDGNIRATTWNIQGNPLRGQSFGYTPKSQLAQATYGLVNQTTPTNYTFTADGNNRYSEGSLKYDFNGNITQLQRMDGAGFTSFNALYDLVPNTNKLDKLRSGANMTSTLAQYGYNQVGETISQVDAANGATPASDRKLEYDAAGRVTAIYVRPSPGSSPVLLTSYAYDEQGNRISELVYPNPIDRTAYKRTYYLRDGSGNVLSTYFLDSSVGQLQLREQVIYGATRLGVYRRAYGNEPSEQLYEHYDHLGNTRVVFRRPITTTYLLTMENARVQQEKSDFPDPTNNPGLYDNVRSGDYGHQGSSYSVGLGPNTPTGTNASIVVTGPTKKLTVGKGDKIRIEAYALYPNMVVDQPTPYPSPQPTYESFRWSVGAASLAPTATPNAPKGEALRNTPWQQAISKVRVGLAIPLVSQSARTMANGFTQAGTTPNAALQYVFTGTDGTVTNGTAMVTQDAENNWQQLTLSTDIDRPGTLEVSMTSYDRQQVYFDDLKIEHEVGPIVQENNFYAYGMPMPGISWSRPNFTRERSGYQGLYAQYDEETKLNSFQLRMYDAKVGRWLSTDPYGQYASPYTGMGNNPVNGSDSNGGFFQEFKNWASGNHWLSNAGVEYMKSHPGSTYNGWTGGNLTGHATVGFTDSEGNYNWTAFKAIQDIPFVNFSRLQGVLITELKGYNGGGYGAVTLPPFGIFTTHADPRMMEHEYGHMQQYYNFGSNALTFYTKVGIPSIFNEIENSYEEKAYGGQYYSVPHSYSETETEANRMSAFYYESILGQSSRLGNADYPFDGMSADFSVVDRMKIYLYHAISDSKPDKAYYH